MLDEGRENICGRNGDLVSYLYGELERSEAAAFETHLSACGPCRAEAKSFGEIRAVFSEMRGEALSTAPRLVIETRNERVGEWWLATLSAAFGGLRGLTAAAAFAAVVAMAVTFALYRTDRDAALEVASNTFKGNDSANRGAPVETAAAPEPAQRPIQATSDASGTAPTSTPASARKADSNGSRKKLKEPGTKASGSAPTLSTYDEEEDKSLRLSDLFDDIGG